MTHLKNVQKSIEININLYKNSADDLKITHLHDRKKIKGKVIPYNNTLSKFSLRKKEIMHCENEFHNRDFT